MFFKTIKLVKKNAKHSVEQKGSQYVVRNPYGHLVNDRRGQVMFFKTKQGAKTYAKLLDEKAE